MSKIILEDLYRFIHSANLQTHEYDITRENLLKTNWKKQTIKQEHLSWQNRHTGFLQCHSSTTVSFKNIPIWMCSYAGGMYDQNRDLARKTYIFLKQALSVRDPGFQSFRGPEGLMLDNWEYTYKQEGDIEEFIGHEEIYFQKVPVFYHRIIGGLIIT